MLRKSETPLQQLVKQFSELDYNNSVLFKNNNTNLGLKKNHAYGPLSTYLLLTCVKIMFFNLNNFGLQICLLFLTVRKTVFVY